MRAECLRDLHREGAHAAAGTVNQHAPSASSEQPADSERHLEQMAIEGVHGCSADADKDIVVAGGRPLDLAQLQDVRRAGALLHDCFHAATTVCCCATVPS